MRAIRTVEAWLFAAGRAERLAAMRIGLCAVLALRLTRTVYVRLAEQPASSFRPMSFMRLLSHQPPRGAVIALQAVGFVAAVLATIGLRTRLSLPVAWACGVFLGGMATSIGKVVHNDVLLLLCMVPLLIAPCADAWSVDARARPSRLPAAARYGWPVRTAVVIVAGSYFFAGFWKLVASGFAWVTSGNMRWILYASSDGHASPNHAALFVADRPWLAHLMALGTILVEIGFPIVLFSRRVRVPMAIVTVALHLGIWVTMGLDYWAQAATVVVVLVDWPSIRRAPEVAPAPT